MERIGQGLSNWSLANLPQEFAAPGQEICRLLLRLTTPTARWCGQHDEVISMRERIDVVSKSCAESKSSPAQRRCLDF